VADMSGDRLDEAALENPTQTYLENVLTIKHLNCRRSRLSYERR
jgi:hypothetical protein